MNNYTGGEYVKYFRTIQIELVKYAAQHGIMAASIKPYT